MDGRVTRRIVTVPLDGTGSDDATAVLEVAGDSNFLAHPRISPDGRRITWLAWDHPRMPWEGTELRLADLQGGVATNVRTMLGGPEESVLQPEWADDSTLYAVSDRTGWWNLYRLAIGESDRDEASTDKLPDPEPLCGRDEEFGFPMWVLGYASYRVLADGRIAVLHGTGAYSLGLLDPSSGKLTDVDVPFTVWTPTPAVVGEDIAAVVGSATEPLTVVRINLGTGDVQRLRPSLDRVPDPAYLPEPRSDALPGPDGAACTPTSTRRATPMRRPPTVSCPPYVVFVHGGPTGAVAPDPDLDIAYFTSRGIGVRRRQLRRLDGLRARLPRAACAGSGASSTSRTASRSRRRWSPRARPIAARTRDPRRHGRRLDHLGALTTDDALRGRRPPTSAWPTCCAFAGHARLRVALPATA